MEFFNLMISRPITPIVDFEKALDASGLKSSELELIEYIRYTGVFSQPKIMKDLRIASKPPVLSVLCEICRKVGHFMPEHFAEVRNWSKTINEYGVQWDGDLVCSATRNIDGRILSPSEGTSLYDILAVHKELFTGLD